ncbi:brain protein I3-like [Patiria miniata]|uniref:Membrane protein BRI3 n=1 Tax=Patiria miniata TaxID=46514 RepID=A0A914AQ17_PATMI|nr:brain protein I3-like [Patiria miniata]
MEPPPAYDHTKQPAYPPPQSYQQQGYAPQPQPQPMQQPMQQPTVVQVTVPAQTTSHIVTVGNCPVCHIGNMREEFSAVGIVLAVLFFPLGVICCLMMTEKVCPHCGARFGA